MAVLRVLHNYIYEVEDPTNHKVLRDYILIKFKNKLAYNCWAAKTEITALFMNAILKTIDEMKHQDLMKAKNHA
jgi:hypothetical protein